MGVFMDKPINFHVGFEDEYGEQRWGAWGEGDTATFYPGAIPLDVVESAIGWEPIQAPMMYTDIHTGLPRPYGSVDDEGTYVGPMVVINGTTGAPVGYNGGKTDLNGGFRPWFIEGASEILQTNAHELGTAGLFLINGGATAVIQIDLIRTIGDAATGIDFRPFIWMAKALDGSMKPKVGRGHTRIVCRNTMAMAFGEANASGQIWTPGKNTKGIKERTNWADARAALDLLSVTAEDLTAEFRAMCETPVPTPTWHAFLDRWSPTTDTKTGEPLTGRSLTMAENKRDALEELWINDMRVAPWKNTVYGVSQAVTTYGQHMSIVRNVSRIERNATNLVNGKSADEESRAMAVLREVMAVAA